MKRTKTILTTVLVVFGALIVGAFVMNNLAPSPVKAAKNHCVEQGWEDSELTLSGFETSARISGSEGTVRLNGNRQNQQKTIRVELLKGLFATKWHVVEYDETGVEERPRDDAEP